MMASIQMSGLTLLVRRYDITSNSPSGGTNEMTRSDSNLLNLTLRSAVSRAATGARGARRTIGES